MVSQGGTPFVQQQQSILPPRPLGLLIQGCKKGYIHIMCTDGGYSIEYNLPLINSLRQSVLGRKVITCYVQVSEYTGELFGIEYLSSQLEYTLSPKEDG